MMGHKGTLKGGGEWDALTRWKKVLHWKPGERKLIKRRYNKRQRKMWRGEVGIFRPDICQVTRAQI